MNIDLNDRHVIITGGAGALGTAAVALFLKAGASVSVPCLNHQEHDSFKYKNESSVFPMAGVDLTNEEQTEEFYKSAVEKQGPLWASVHIAGGFAMGSVENTSLNDFENQFKLNTVTCYNACRAALHRMLHSPHEGGRMVNVAARPALEPRQGKGMVAYTASKAAVAALTEALAAEVVENNVLVNAVAPSVIDTPANRKAMPKADYNKWPKPEEIASQILYLSSPGNLVTRGAVVPVYGKS